MGLTRAFDVASHGRLAFGWIVFVGTFAFYACSLAPGIESWDTGELQTDANALFVAHPTGFPLFLLCGWFFAHVFPFGDPAWRISLFSATAVAFAATMLAQFIYELTRNALASIAAAFAFAPIGIVWTTAVRADAHDLALAFAALALTYGLRAQRTLAFSDVRVAALAWGAAVAAHPIALFALPAVFVLAQPALAKGSLRDAGLACVLCAVPLLAYAYVPLRSLVIEHAGLDPNVALGLHGAALVDDGAPSTLESFANYLLATRFAPAGTLSQIGTSFGAAHAVAFAYALLYGMYGYLALALALVGAFALGARSRRIVLALIIVAAGGIGFAANYSIESEPSRYALTALWVISAFAGYGAWWFANAVVQRTNIASVATAVLLGLGLVPTYAAAHARVVERERYADGRREAGEVTRATADGSVIVATWSFATPLAYAKYVTHTLGSRRIVSGWPGEYYARYGAWKQTYAHVYTIVDSRARATVPGIVRYTSPDGNFRIFEYSG